MVRCWGTKWELLHEKSPDKGLMSDKNGFLLLSPVGTSRGLEDVNAG